VVILGDEHEITFQEYYDFQARARYPAATNKIDNACGKAKSHGFSYLWIDSCCIDKKSSNELSEAINSMFKWYQNSKRCYVFLSDFQSGLTESRSKNPTPITEAQRAKFSECRWFKRGWTLQELLAPRNALFYDCNWFFFGVVSEITPLLSIITKIPQDVLNGTMPLYNYSIAQKMSWAATRQTTREEDMAYCLFGLFRINLPLFYGEGSNKAFFRLQEAIMKESNDLTLFAWQNPNKDCYRGILARSPAEFSWAGDIKHTFSVSQNPEFSMTNKGLKIETVLEEKNGLSLMLLNCGVNTDPTPAVLCISLVIRSGMAVRDLPNQLFSLQACSSSSLRRVYIAKDVRILKNVPLVGSTGSYNRPSDRTMKTIAASRL
jgi:hypothetical protein